MKARIAGGLADIVPVGHGMVETYPDRPYLEWSFDYHTGVHGPEDSHRNNTVNFLEGCEALHDFFSNFADLIPGSEKIASDRRWDEISGIVSSVVQQESTQAERSQLWTAAITSGALFPILPADRNIRYDDNLWQIRIDSRNEIDAQKFAYAAYKHRTFVLDELLPSIGLNLY